MAPDERERNFDKALGRHLRSTAATGKSAPTPADSPSLRASCPDSETLAAYHERSLLPEQMNSCKEHIVGCANCQTILAQLEATDQIVLQPDKTEAPAEQESAPVMTARSLEPVPASAAPRKSRRVLLLRGARWQWLAPAGAIAASLLVWIALHKNQPAPLPSLKQDQIALKQPPPPMPSAPSPEPRAYSSPRAVLVKPQSPTDELAASNARAASEAMKPSEKLYDQVQHSPSKPSAGKENGLRKDEERARMEEALSAENKLDRDAKSVPGAKQESAGQQLRVQTQTVEVQAQNQNVQNTQNAPKPGPSQMGQAATSVKRMKSSPAASAPAPPPQGVTGGAAGYSDSTAATSELVVATLSDPHLIVPPASAFLWRAGRAGVIDFSPNSGNSWSRQSSGVLVDLYTGSAPSQDVCWVVGRLGTVLLTTDGGAHWKLLSSPTKDDMGGVRATDAQHATIWNLHGTKIFETTDGGLTWKSVSHP